MPDAARLSLDHVGRAAGASLAKGRVAGGVDQDGCWVAWAMHQEGRSQEAIGAALAVSSRQWAKALRCENAQQTPRSAAREQLVTAKSTRRPRRSAERGRGAEGQPPDRTIRRTGRLPDARGGRGAGHEGKGRQ